MTLVQTASVDENIFSKCSRSEDGTCPRDSFKLYHHDVKDEPGVLSIYCCNPPVLSSNVHFESTYSIVPPQSYDVVELKSGERKTVPLVKCAEEDGVFMCSSSRIGIKCEQSSDQLSTTINYSSGYIEAYCQSQP